MTKGILTKVSKGFTLIELLIVVAIIAILAAIAVPNFLEAQTRAKVSRVRADLRSIATGLESYFVDNNKYPPTPYTTGLPLLRVVPTRLSTPIAYLSSANFTDPFIGPLLGDFEGIDGNGAIGTYGFDAAFQDPEGNDPLAGRRYYYVSNIDQRRYPENSGTYSEEDQAEVREVEGAWVLASIGNDRARNLETIPDFPVDVLIPYDPTNGTVSDGDIIRSAKSSEGDL